VTSFDIDDVFRAIAGAGSNGVLMLDDEDHTVDVEGWVFGSGTFVVVDSDGEVVQRFRVAMTEDEDFDDESDDESVEVAF
jgi:hypothetical protein